MICNLFSNKNNFVEEYEDSPFNNEMQNEYPDCMILLF